MEYIVYETINLVNNKIYIGVHDSNKFDGYLGNGIWKQNPDSYKKPKTLLGYAINKYGIKNFRRITLKTFKTYLEAVDFKDKLVAKIFSILCNFVQLYIKGQLIISTPDP